MENTKKFVTDFLQDAGASEETLTKFNELYDDSIQEAIAREAQGRFYQSREDMAKSTQNIQDLAAKHNIRNK